MTESTVRTSGAQRAYGQLLHLHTRLLTQLREIRDHYDVIHDENRGWIIKWKEYTATGSVRGSGQFYEHPYAWIDQSLPHQPRPQRRQHLFSVEHLDVPRLRLRDPPNGPHQSYIVRLSRLAQETHASLAR